MVFCDVTAQIWGHVGSTGQDLRNNHVLEAEELGLPVNNQAFSTLQRMTGPCRQFGPHV